MNLHLLKPGHKVGLRGGGTAEVLSETQDGEWILVRYLEADDPSLAGSEDLASANEIETLLGIVHPTEWRGHCTVHVHHVPEGEESEEGYEALTMGGVPYGVSITGYGDDSAQEALDQLLCALKAFGFSGTVRVEDATYIGGVQRYEVAVS